ncbi:hypothetical protein [Paraburkholderia sp. MM5384-R2]|nr:hypothetical protein [Paraburkholderia sp. MM5384-R2]
MTIYIRNANVSDSENMKSSERYSSKIQKLREARTVAAACANAEDASV